MAETLLPPVECSGAAATARRDIAALIGWFALLSVVYWAAVLIVSGQIGFPLDDAFIHLQFARNLYEDGQMTFNEGIPSSGSTAPLWPMVLAGLYPLIRNWYLTSLLLGAMCSLGTTLAVYGIVQSWTARPDLARWAGLLTVFMSPTVMQAYVGMESAAYSLCFLVGLWLYASPRFRLLASGVFALCVWLRPEFLVMLPLIWVERMVTARRSGHRRFGAFFAEIWPHFLIWVVMVSAYMFYNWRQDGHLVPTTFEAKALAPGIVRPAWFNGLPAALERGDLLCILLAIVVWPAFILLSCGIGLGVNCLPLGLGVREALWASWHDHAPEAPAKRLAVLTLVGYPWLRGLVDPAGVFLFQFQRYYAHLTPLLVIIVIGMLPVTGAVVTRRFWNWRDRPLGFQQRRTFCWAAGASILFGILGVIAVSNINSMQVSLGHWVETHTTDRQLVATNDIGAIGFISRRPILDTIGLVEPGIVKHYLRGGDLLSYLREKDPAYVIIFPKWYPDLSGRADVLEPVHSVTLPCNVACGGPTMVVYQPKWEGAGGM